MQPALSQQGFTVKHEIQICANLLSVGTRLLQWKGQQGVCLCMKKLGQISVRTCYNIFGLPESARDRRKQRLGVDKSQVLINIFKTQPTEVDGTHYCVHRSLFCVEKNDAFSRTAAGC